MSQYTPWYYPELEQAPWVLNYNPFELGLFLCFDQDVEMPDWIDFVDMDVQMDEVDEDIVMTLEDQVPPYSSPPPTYSSLAAAAMDAPNTQLAAQPLLDQVSPSSVTTRDNSVKDLPKICTISRPASSHSSVPAQSPPPYVSEVLLSNRAASVDMGRTTPPSRGAQSTSADIADVLSSLTLQTEASELDAPVAEPPFTTTNSISAGVLSPLDLFLKESDEVDWLCQWMLGEPLLGVTGTEDSQPVETTPLPSLLPPLDLFGDTKPAVFPSAVSSPLSTKVMLKPVKLPDPNQPDPTAEGAGKHRELRKKKLHSGLKRIKRYVQQETRPPPRKRHDPKRIQDISSSANKLSRPMEIGLSIPRPDAPGPSLSPLQRPTRHISRLDRPHAARL